MSYTPRPPMHDEPRDPQPCNPKIEECVMCGHDTEATHGQYEPEGFICDDCYW